MPCNLDPQDDESDIGDDDSHSVASQEYKLEDHLPRRVSFASRRNNKCSYNPSKKDKVDKEYPWPGFLDYDFYSTVNHGKVTDVYPWPDFLVCGYYDEESQKSYLEEKYPPLEWKGKRTFFWDTVADQSIRRRMY